MRNFTRSWVVTTDRELGFSSLTLPRRLSIHLWLSIVSPETPVKMLNVTLARKITNTKGLVNYVPKK